ncbi:uncharacterized protein LOC128255389 [Drosophila gunungcola]|uniref:Uncharacterized protein n=1 Tax=Drosophila gunungcola TaxID=103775 RepID=A0A9P9YIY6_9MUSC|nr:uncharacterized protein LOC128255389 [Drosophila gunungcola]KAI8037620.1 hypothetical protein M5D96_009782 [Drosophila gunungcola]
MFLAVQFAGYQIDDFVLSSYESYLKNRPRPYTLESWERGINILVGLHVVILYVLFRIREYLRFQNLEDIRRQWELEALFRMETEFIEQLRSQGIELQDPSLGFPDASCP